MRFGGCPLWEPFVLQPSGCFHNWTLARPIQNADLRRRFSQIAIRNTKESACETCVHLRPWRVSEDALGIANAQVMSS
jgi:hypothetical protein